MVSITLIIIFGYICYLEEEFDIMGYGIGIIIGILLLILCLPIFSQYILRFKCNKKDGSLNGYTCEI